MRFDLYDKASVGGSGGDVTQSGNNTFTGTNTFSGTTTFNNLAIGTITVVSNLTVPNNPYGAGWNGSTDVPNENSVYGEMELRAPKASPSFTGAATNTGSFGAPTLYVGSTNVAAALASFISSDTNWNGTPIASGTITNLETSTIGLGGKPRTSWPAASTRQGEHIYVSFILGSGVAITAAGSPWYTGGALASGTMAFPSSAGGAIMGADSSYLRAVSSSSANGGYHQSTRADMFVLTTNDWTAFYFRPLATNDTVIFSRLGWSDSITTSLPVDGLYISRTGSVLSLVARSNSIETASSTTYTIASNTPYWGTITLKDSGGTFAADLTISNSTTLLSTMSVTGNIPNTFTRATGHGAIAWSTNAVAVNLEDWGYMEVFNQTSR